MIISSQVDPARQSLFEIKKELREDAPREDCERADSSVSPSKIVTPALWSSQNAKMKKLKGWQNDGKTHQKVALVIPSLNMTSGSKGRLLSGKADLKK